MKKLLLGLFVAFAFTACNNGGDQAAAAGEESGALSVDQLTISIADLVGQEIAVEGDVDHVCKHGGTKMVILGDSMDIHIKATDESGNFRADEVMDHRVTVFGIVDEFRLDDNYIAEKEAELEEMIATGGEEDGEEHAEGEEHHEKGMFPDNDNKHKKQVAGLEKQIAGLQAMLDEAKAEGKEYVSFYSVKAQRYEIQEDVEVKSEGKAYSDSEEEAAADDHDHDHDGEGHDHDHDGHEGHDHE